MRNLYTEFLKLVPSDPQQYVEVLTHNADGTSTVALPSGEQFLVQGQGVSVSAHAFVQGGRIVGEAPSLPYYSATV